MSASIRSNRDGAAPSAAPLASDLPDEFSPEPESGAQPPDAPSLMSDIDALLTDGKTYLEAELTYQKSRAGFTANRLKAAALYGVAAFGLLHLALIALTVGAVIALTPLIGPWLATAAVVVVLLLGTFAFVMKLRGKISDIGDVFEGSDQ